MQFARTAQKEGSTLLRFHPGGMASYVGAVDLSQSPLGFLSDVKAVWTVNSSLGIEAMFWGKEFRLFGESPVSTFFDIIDCEREAFTFWFFIRYLVPFDLRFEKNYYAWRLCEPRAEEIGRRHIAHYRSTSSVDWKEIPLPTDLKAGQHVVQMPPPRDIVPELYHLRDHHGNSQPRIDHLSAELEQLRAVVLEQVQALTDRDQTLAQINGILSDVRTAARKFPGVWWLIKRRLLKYKRGM